MALSCIEEGLEELKQGRILIVTDDEDRENEGDFIVAGEKITEEIVNFMLTFGRGIMCVPLTEERCKELHLDVMVPENTSLLGTPFTMSVDLMGYGCTTGVSVHDRCATVKALMNPQTKPEELARPGHMFPLNAAKNGVLERPGHTEAVIDMTHLAGLNPGGVLIEILNADGSMARLPQLEKIAKEHNLKICTIADLIQYRIQHNL